MTISTLARRSRTGAGFNRLVLIAFVLATAALLAPGGVGAENTDGWDGRRGGEPGGGPPTNGANGDAGGGVTGGVNSDPGVGVTGDTTTTATVTSDVNLRSGPSVESDVLAVIPAGSAVQITGGGQGGFVSVVFNGVSGFVSGDYIGGGGAAQPSASTAQPSAPAAQASAPAAAVTDGPLPVVIATDAVVADDAAANPDMVAIIYAAADAYGQSRADMLRVAACESNLDSNAVNAAGGSYGLFQFIPSTWASTPFANQDIFDPVASANAAAWMWSVGRRGEWVCQ